MKGISQAQLAKIVRMRTPISTSTIGHIESGRNETSRLIVWIAAALNIRPEWLVTGQGEMFDDWPWQDINRTHVLDLQPETIEEIGRFIKFKMAEDQAKSFHAKKNNVSNGF